MANSMTKKFDIEGFFKNDPNNVLDEDKSFIISRLKKFGESGDEAANYVYVVKYLSLYNQLQKSIEALGESALYAKEYDAVSKFKIKDGPEKIKAYCLKQIEELESKKSIIDTYTYSLSQYANMLYNDLNLDEVSYEDLDRTGFIEDFDEKIDKALLGTILEADKDSILSKLRIGANATQAARETYFENHKEDEAQARNDKNNAQRRIRAAEKKGASVKEEDLKKIAECVERINNLGYYFASLKAFAKQEERKLRPPVKQAITATTEPVEPTEPAETETTSIETNEPVEVPETIKEEIAADVETRVEEDPERDVVFTERELEILNRAGYNTEEKLNEYINKLGIGVVKATLSIVMNAQDKVRLEMESEKATPEK